MEGGKLAKGRLEFAIDVANDETVGKYLLAQKQIEASMVWPQESARFEGRGLASWELPLYAPVGGNVVLDELDEWSTLIEVSHLLG